MALKAVVEANHALRVKNLVFYVFSDPGIGKTSLAFTASRPMLFDFDIGAHRCGPLRRGKTVPVENWQDVADIEASDVENVDTIILDTAGRMLEVIKSYLAENKNNRQNDGALKLKAQGYANEIFKNWISRIRSFGKDIIIIAHAIEDKKGDDIIIRPDVGGKNRNELYRQADLMGYLTTIDSQKGKSVRMLNFTPSTAYHAKNSGGLGNVELPDLAVAPSFFANLISASKDHINSLTEEQVLEMKNMDDLANFKNDCELCTNASELNELIERLAQDHPYVKQMRLAFAAAARGLAVNFDKEKGCYFDRPATNGTNPVTDPGIKDKPQAVSTQATQATPRIDVMRHLKAITNAINIGSLNQAVNEIPEGISTADKELLNRAFHKRNAELTPMDDATVDSIIKRFQEAPTREALSALWDDLVSGFSGVIPEKHKASLDEAFYSADFVFVSSETQE